MNPLTTRRLRIRGFGATDTAKLHEIAALNWPRVGTRQRTLDEMQAMFADMEGRAPGETGWYQFIVEAPEPEGVVGSIGVNFGGPGEQQAEIGYSFHPNSWGRGYGAEALGSILTYLYDVQRLHRVVAITGIDNVASRRLLERLGFRLEAETRESFLHHAEGRFVDEAMYALLAREWAHR